MANRLTYNFFWASFSMGKRRNKHILGRMGVQYTRWPFSIFVAMRARLKSYLCLQWSEKTSEILAPFPTKTSLKGHLRTSAFQYCIIHQPQTQGKQAESSLQITGKESIIHWPTWNNLILEGFLDCSQDVAQIYSEAVLLKYTLKLCWS